MLGKPLQELKSVYRYVIFPPMEGQHEKVRLLFARLLLLYVTMWINTRF